MHQAFHKINPPYIRRGNNFAREQLPQNQWILVFLMPLSYIFMAVPIKDSPTPSGESLLSAHLLTSDGTLSYQGDDNPDRNGYPPDLFQQQVADEYLCNMCRRVLCKPMATDCGCRFCNLCIMQYISGAGDAVRLKCPGCDDYLMVPNLHIDSFAKKHLQKRTIFCENRQFGCQEIFRLDGLGKHLVQCLYRAEECRNGCGEKLWQSTMDRHLTNECPLRMVACDYCGQSFRLKELETHGDECRENLVQCPNNCNTVGIHRDLLDRHLEKECPEEHVKCLFQALGCDHECRRKDLEEHLGANTEMHYMKLGGEVLTLKTALSEMQLQLDQVRSAQSASSEASAGVDKLSEMMKKLQMTIVQTFDKIGKLEKGAEQTAKKSEVHSQASRVDTLASQTNTLSNRVQKLEDKSGQGPRGRKGAAGGAGNQSLEQRHTTLENQVSLHSMRLAEHDVRFQVHGSTSYNGCLVWKIKDYTRRKADADSGKTLSLYSQPFYSSRYGFKMCARVYLNGDGIGKGTHMSLFFVIMKGDYDALLTWPFKQKVTLMLLDQESGRRHLSDTFRPDPTSSSFQRPTAEMNIASGCPLFVSQDVLRNSAYLNEDTIFLRFVVDLEGLDALM